MEHDALNDKDIQKEIIEKEADCIEKNEQHKEKEKKGFFYEWGLPIISAIILALLINKFLLFKVYIPSESMVPTLNVEDRLFVSRIYNYDKLERGNIIVFDSKEYGETMIKRLIGLPGDHIEIMNGVVSINGETLDEPYVKNTDNYYGTFDVPEGKYFFLGDNRPVSADSRKWINPYIDQKDIMGKAQIKIYPFKDFGSVK
ncbi:MAG: signal peptidase I [Clostridium sp.]